MTASPAEPAAAADPSLVLLDVGGPIYDDVVYRDALLRATRELAAERGTAVDAEAFQRVYDECRQAQQGSLRTAVAARFLTTADRPELSRRAAAHWEYPSEALYPDVLPALRELAGKYAIAIVANQRALVVDALRRDGIAEHVDVWAISETVGAEKPDPAIFEYALQQAGVPAEQAVHVGNRLDTDVRGARRVGLRTVWVVRGEAPPEPTPQQRAEADVTIPALSELPAALHRLGRARPPQPGAASRTGRGGRA
ncbi:HAD family hydrolase [Bounagaea algeriensis]